MIITQAEPYHMFWLGLVKFCLLPGHHGPSLESQPMPPSYKVWLSLWIVLKLSLFISHTDKVKMAGELSTENVWSSTQNLKSRLNLDLALDSKAVQSYLNFSKDIDDLRDTKSVGECSSNSCVQENRDDLQYDPETDEITLFLKYESSQKPPKPSKNHPKTNKTTKKHMQTNHTHLQSQRKTPKIYYSDILTNSAHYHIRKAMRLRI